MKALPYFTLCHNPLAISEVLTSILYLTSPLLQPRLTMLVSHIVVHIGLLYPQHLNFTLDYYLLDEKALYVIVSMLIIIMIIPWFIWHKYQTSKPLFINAANTYYLYTTLFVTIGPVVFFFIYICLFSCSSVWKCVTVIKSNKWNTVLHQHEVIHVNIFLYE